MTSLAPMTALYHPRPERWPQVSLRGLLTALTLACVLAATILPDAIAAFREWSAPRSWYARPLTKAEQADLDKLIDQIEESLANPITRDQNLTIGFSSTQDDPEKSD